MDDIRKMPLNRHKIVTMVTVITQPGRRYDLTLPSTDNHFAKTARRSAQNLQGNDRHSPHPNKNMTSSPHSPTIHHSLSGTRA